MSLPIRRDPVTMLVQDPDAPRREGEPAPMIEKTYESFYVDARSAGRGRLRAPSIAEAHKIGEPLAMELAREGVTAIKLSPEDKRTLHGFAALILVHHIALADGEPLMSHGDVFRRTNKRGRTMTSRESLRNNLPPGPPGRSNDQQLHARRPGVTTVIPSRAGMERALCSLILLVAVIV
jgi:hypothetical protein